jgi:hypothetical protein
LKHIQKVPDSLFNFSLSPVGNISTSNIVA